MLETRNEDTQRMKQSHFRRRDGDDSVSRRKTSWDDLVVEDVRLWKWMGVDWGAAAPVSSSLLQGSPLKLCKQMECMNAGVRSEDDSQPLRWITLSRAGLSLTFQKGILDECLSRTVKLQLHDVSRWQKRWCCVRMTHLHLKLCSEALRSYSS